MCFLRVGHFYLLVFNLGYFICKDLSTTDLKSNFADQRETRKRKTAETGTRFIATASRTESGRRGPEFYLHDNKQIIFISIVALKQKLEAIRN